MKHVEVFVEAPTPWGIVRGTEWVVAEIEKGTLSGSAIVRAFDATVRWRITDVATPAELEPVPPASAEAAEPPAARNLPDISSMDMEGVKGVVDTTGSEAELEILGLVEQASARFSGGRKAVATLIEHRRAELRELSRLREQRTRRAGEVLNERA
jgi:hypothetical protein